MTETRYLQLERVSIIYFEPNVDGFDEEERGDEAWWKRRMGDGGRCIRRMEVKGKGLGKRREQSTQ